jgi:hypothetical protein
MGRPAGLVELPTRSCHTCVIEVVAADEHLRVISGEVCGESIRRVVQRVDGGGEFVGGEIRQQVQGARKGVRGDEDTGQRELAQGR